MKKNFNYFKCAECKDAQEMEVEQLKKHLTEVHNIDLENTKMRSQLVMHVDGQDWYSSQNKITFETGLIIHQFCKNKRSKNDPMRFS